MVRNLFANALLTSNGVGFSEYISYWLIYYPNIVEYIHNSQYIIYLREYGKQISGNLLNRLLEIFNSGFDD